MGFYVSPGVYARERDISNLIPNLATTTAAVVGYARKGSTTDIQLITSGQQFVQEYGEPNPVDGYFHYTALAFLEKGNKLFALRVVNGALFGGENIRKSGTGANNAFTAGVSTPVFNEPIAQTLVFQVFGRDPGVWNNEIGIRITNLDAVEFEFDIDVYAKDEDGNPFQVETWRVSRKHKVDGFGRQMYLEDRINGFSRYIVVKDDVAEADTSMPEPQATTLFMDFGSDGSAITDANLITAWGSFSNPDDIDIRILMNAGYTSVSVQQKIKEICESRRDCFGILDTPFSELTNVTSMVDWRKNTQNFNSSYIALYTAWVKIYDAFNDKIIEIPPSGYVGAQFAFNDFVGEPWLAPAGFNRGVVNVIGVTNVFSQGERDILYIDQLNPIQMFRGEGIVIWGQKTEQRKASALDRVNVRRLLIVLEKAIATQLKFFVFEPNNQITRFRITSLIEEFLTLLSARNAFQTELGDQGFRVLCDETNNTPAIIDLNELHVDVFIKPSRAAEFIQLQLIVTSTGASFDELIARGVFF